MLIFEVRGGGGGALAVRSGCKTCKDLGDHFASRINSKFGTYDEVHVIFDDYTVKNSLKIATRSKRLGGLASVRYRTVDSAKIQHIPMKKPLSHEEGTKDELTMFFSEKIMHMAMRTGQQYVVAWGNMSTLYLICVAMQVLMKKLTQRLFSMLLTLKGLRCFL